MTFSNKDDYNKILEDDKINILGLKEFQPGNTLNCEIVHIDGSKDKILLSHTYNHNQIDWFKAGSALNLIAKNNG